MDTFEAFLNRPFTHPVDYYAGRRTRDNRRQKLYSAERKAFGEGVQYKTVDECQARVDKITHSRWWRSRYGFRPNVTVKPGKGHRRATASPGTLVIQLPRWARSDWVICHELAHLIQPRVSAFHGPEFCREYLALVNRWIGREAAQKLRKSFVNYHVKYRVRKGAR